MDRGSNTTRLDSFARTPECRSWEKFSPFTDDRMCRQAGARALRCARPRPAPQPPDAAEQSRDVHEDVIVWGRGSGNQKKDIHEPARGTVVGHEAR